MDGIAEGGQSAGRWKWRNEMPGVSKHNHAGGTLNLALFVAFCTAVIAGGVVALPILAEHFFGTRRQPEFVIDLLIFGGICAILAAILLSNHFGYTEWLNEQARRLNAEKPAPPCAVDTSWAQQVCSDARLARGASHLSEVAHLRSKPGNLHEQ